MDGFKQDQQMLKSERNEKKEQKVDNIEVTNEEKMYEMAEEFEVDGEKVEGKQARREHPKSYVDGCDMGWC
ncbi:DUF2553 family protein [Texcoconibacillus texcoconensis]|uniref:Uncharacterized protein n=1 Tax=Texcoconibacillus texcoconensis TaxID=1095777 RepID=A0A840QQ97_9BACI|nr:DUF2553 family protein [Texcoconibacillus texcoconensis]MBB5173511.1 hypothetical protein [Texcoconibacillus texcoconensis]